jgi:hypothetical protein
VAWLIALPALLALVAWIGTRSPIRQARAAAAEAAAEAETETESAAAGGEDD